MLALSQCSVSLHSFLTSSTQGRSPHLFLVWNVYFSVCLSIHPFVYMSYVPLICLEIPCTCVFYGSGFLVYHIPITNPRVTISVGLSEDKSAVMKMYGRAQTSG